MTLTTGTQLGPYEILAPLGAGGMGEVYRARDTRLERAVAIKVLPVDFAHDGERLRRFEQEAKATSALNHPNILTIYDISQHDGAPFIVAELLEGEELRAQLNDGPLPLRQALEYAQQIAAGLAAAHERGVVHRDLKPENLFITKDGRVKILDFGLAKLKPPKLADGVDSEAPTQRQLTNPGVIMGTVGYMAPEQVRGAEADHRADIFAFGLILYEMLAGKRAFLRETLAETMTAILKEEPKELTTLNSKVPPPLERVVRRCLEKRPERRFHSAHDLGFALEALSTPSGTRLETIAALPAVMEPPSAGGKARLFGDVRLAWIVAAVAVLVSLASLPFTIVHFRHAPLEAQTTRTFVLPPEKSTLGTITISPDGRRLAFVATDASGKSLLYLRPLDSLTAQPLSGTDDALYPFWSPDSRFLGFFAQGKLKKIDVLGGPAQTLCDAPRGRGGSWSRDEVIIFAPGMSDSIERVSAAGGKPTPVTALEPSRQVSSHRFPQFLPDGRHFFYFARSGQAESRGIYLGSLDSKETKQITSADSNAAYAPPGYLLFRREGALMAQRFDSHSLQLTGQAFPVAEQVGFNATNSEAYFSVSETGVLIYRGGGGGSARTQLIWIDRGGKQTGIPTPPAEYRAPWLAPDEKRVVVDRRDSQSGVGDLWLLDLARGTSSRFTFDPAFDASPVWSPDGSSIVFASNRDGRADLYQKSASGAGSEELLLKSSNSKYPMDWSLDGRFILYEEIDPKTRFDLWVLPLFGERKPLPFLQSPFDEQYGAFSPDGKWLAYKSNELGTYQVYVQSFPAAGGKWQVSTNGGDSPRWRRDGRELFYLAPDNKLMAVEVKAGSSFEAGAPKALFEARGILSITFGARYAVSADGQRFLFNLPVEDASTTPITVVLNWTAEVKR